MARYRKETNANLNIGKAVGDFKNKESNEHGLNQQINNQKKQKNKSRLGKTVLKTKLRQKSKLVVYKGDNLMIDNSAAFALGLIGNEEMMQNDGYYPITNAMLQNILNTGKYEMEYKSFEKQKSIGTLKQELENLDKGEYGIGVHGVFKFNEQYKEAVAKEILEKGLNIRNNSKTVLSTSVSLGENDSNSFEEIQDYQYGTGAKTNVIIAVPLYMKNKRGDIIFLGYPEKNKTTVAQQYEEHCIFDRVCSKLRKVPPQFILGYYSDDHGRKKYVPNEKYYLNLPQREKDELFGRISANMDDISKSYSDMILNGQTERLTSIKEQFEKMGFGSQLIDNCICLCQKYKDKGLRKEEQENIELQDEYQKEQQNDEHFSSHNGTRRVLLSAINNVTKTDLNTALATLEKGLDKEKIKEQGIENEY